MTYWMVGAALSKFLRKAQLYGKLAVYFSVSVTRKLPHRLTTLLTKYFFLMPKVKHKLVSVTSQRAIAKMR
jgi:hypothetical protein